jgi:hypothetical protein
MMKKLILTLCMMFALSGCAATISGTTDRQPGLTPESTRPTNPGVTKATVQFEETVMTSTPIPSATAKPNSGGKKPGTGAVFLESSQLLQQETFPPRIFLRISGDLPTPCHVLKFLVNPPDAENQIQVQIWSESNPKGMCAQMLQPFEESIPLEMEGLASGRYSVGLNGKRIGEINWP